VTVPYPRTQTRGGLTPSPSLSPDRLRSRSNSRSRTPEPDMPMEAPPTPEQGGPEVLPTLVRRFLWFFFCIM
jgi:hypothetical protein